MSLDIFATYATDENLEKNGSIFKLGEDATLLVARGGGRKYQKEMNRLIEMHKDVLDKDDEESDLLQVQIVVAVMAKTILLGWSGLTYKGKPIEYSEANAALLLQHKDFRLKVASLADNIDGYRAKLETEQGEALAPT